jgi:hypothetical protein
MIHLSDIIGGQNLLILDRSNSPLGHVALYQKDNAISMWLYTKLGFFSIVHKPPCKKDELLVRTRCKEDLEVLSQKLSQTSDFKGVIIESTDSDYAFRMVVPRSILAPFMASLIENLDYKNFKATIPYNDQARHEAYFRCWEVMNERQGKVNHRRDK